jgi:hypothetical protein
MSTLTDEAGLPAVPPGEVKITPQARGGVLLEIGRARRIKRVWLSDAEVPLVRDALERHAPRQRKGRQS